MAWIGLMAFLLLGVANFQGMVLCVERDGRLALERAIEGICSDSFQDLQQFHGLQGADESELLADHCKRCVDIPLSIDSVEKHRLQKLLPAAQSTIELVAFAGPPDILSVGYLSTAVAQQLPHPPPLRPPIHQYLGTIVLLI